MKHRFAVVALVMVVLPACSENVQPKTTLQPRPKSTATLTITTPQPSETVSSPFTVQMDLQGGRIIALASKKLEADTGHIHVLIDGRLESQTAGLSQELTAEPGDHLVQAEFVAADHSPFNPRVLASVTVTIQ